MIAIAVLVPGLSFLLRKKWGYALIAFILQVLAIYSLFPTGLGFVLWLVLAAWAVTAYNYSRVPLQQRNDSKSHKMKKG